jgi:signal transduction histidine kinase
MTMVFRRRLFWKVYLALLLSLITVAVLIGGLLWLIGETPREHRVPIHLHFEDLAVPEQDGPAGAIAAALGRLGHELGAADVSLYDSNGALIASRGKPILLAPSAYEPGFAARIMRIDLADGRALLARQGPMPSPSRRMLTIVLIVVGGVGLAAFPITARLTRRLEGLRSGVERWGAGALWTRVDVVGDDEVAVVARTFNAAAERVEALLKSQKALLANASHELRSPLARLRMAIELWLDRPDPKIYEEIARNITEIDQLSEEILLASRLDHAGATMERPAAVDLLGLAAEEAVRVDASFDVLPIGVNPVEIQGDAALLRRLVRNLLENAAKHGSPPVCISVERHEEAVRIVVSDQGPGIAPSERERVFEPFYRPAGHGESCGGWGLGLSLVRQIAKGHGGRVFCDATPGGGARFVVDLASDSLGGRGR